MKHTCHATRCNIEVPPKVLMCIRHWRMVPRLIQNRVWAAYRPDRGSFKSGFFAAWDLLSKAIQVSDKGDENARRMAGAGESGPDDGNGVRGPVAPVSAVGVQRPEVTSDYKGLAHSIFVQIDGAEPDFYGDVIDLGGGNKDYMPFQTEEFFAFRVDLLAQHFANVASKAAPTDCPQCKVWQDREQHTAELLAAKVSPAVAVETFDAGLECAARIVPEVFCPKHEKDTCTRCVVQAIRARKEDPNEEYTCGHCGKGVRGKFLFCSAHCIEAAGFSDVTRPDTQDTD